MKNVEEHERRGRSPDQSRLFIFCPSEFVAVSAWLQPELWRGPQLQAIVFNTDHGNYSQAFQPSKQLQWTLRGVCLCVRVCSVTLCLVMDSCQLKEHDEGYGLDGYQCLLWLRTKRLLCFAQLAIIDGEARDGGERTRVTKGKKKYMEVKRE